MDDWDSLIAELKKEDKLKNKNQEEKISSAQENNRDFEFGDALEESKRKKVELSMKKAEIDPLKMRPNKKVEKLETAGENWFNMPKAEITEEIKRDWDLLRMRSVLKSGGEDAVLSENPPEFLQVGIIQDNPIEGARGRVGRRYRGATITEALVKDAEFRDFLESKYQKLEKKKKKY